MTKHETPEHMSQKFFDEQELEKIANGAYGDRTVVLLIDKTNDGKSTSIHNVQADKQWQSTGAHITEGFEFRINASGTWNVHPRAYPNGHGPEGTGVSCQAGYVLPGGSEGALIGKFGVGGRPFQIGKHYIGKAPSSQTLYLIMNDDIGRSYGDGYGDNRGSISVRITL
jgi:hypothetical protein